MMTTQPDEVRLTGGSVPPPQDDGVRPETEHGTKPANPLEELREELAEEITGLTATYPVPGRPKYAVRYSLDVEGPQLQRWTKQASDKKLPGGVDGTKAAAIVLANMCEAILRVTDGDLDTAEEIYGTDDVVFTFRHPELHEMLGVSRAIAAVQKFYALDGVVIRVAGDLVDEAGYGDEMPDLDPTRRR